jgi:tRNA pseudouridine55 synthase
MARRKRKGRIVNGVLALDKPVGVGSNEILQKVKHLYGAQKAGHTGSLDRLACGLLPICFGEATKLSAYLLESDKSYEARLRLGVKTTTADAEGEVIEQRPIPALTDADIEAVMVPLRGAIMQVPPMFSALKHKGQRLYKLAHRGETVERAPRSQHIYELTLTGRGDEYLDIFVRCSKGTYIRTLGEDLGEALGCGASILTLRRTAAGPFVEQDMVCVEAVEAAVQELNADSLLLPPEAALSDLPALALTDDLRFFMSKGQAVIVPKAPTSGRLRLYGPDECFIGVGEVLDDGRVAPRRFLAC